MKRALLLVGGSCICISAHAQSSVTLYGLIDNGLTYVNNVQTAPGIGHSLTAMTTGNVVGNRFGLTGAEDLGEDLKAIFKLESGFSGQNGKYQQGGRMFGRQAWVGLSDPLGTITVGRQYDSVIDYLGPRSLAQTAVGGQGFAHPFDNDNISDFFRLGNAIKYASPDYYGLTFGGLYALSNQTGAFADNRAYSAGIAYKGGPVSVAASYMQIDKPGDGALGALDGSSTSGDTTFHSTAQRVWGSGINYTIGHAILGFVWSQTTVAETTAINIGSSLAPAQTGTPTYLRFTNYEINARYQLAPDWIVAASYTLTNGRYSNIKIEAKPHWNQINLLTSYALSKLTDVYLLAVYQHVNGSGGTPFNGAFIEGSGGASATSKQFLTTASLRVRF